MQKLCSRYVFTVFIALCMGSLVYGQQRQGLYVGLGGGLDYGGMGGKIEYLPLKNFGIFGGLGYNGLSVGWNTGATFKIPLNQKLSLNPIVFYGYNGIMKVNGASEYNMTSYGVTAGANLDIKVGKNGNKLSAGMFVPIRSKEFMDNYDKIKNAPNFKMEQDLWPILFSFGFNFSLL
jgi:hypothetical protein